MTDLDVGVAFARPGMDPRQWLSYGVVDQETETARSTLFDDAEGNPITYGPIVNVTLQPSNIPVACRVLGHVAGQEEGEWFPFLPGDEVLVAIPEGNERAGCVIMGRLNNEIDVWPRLVAGQDATSNVFGFRRLRTPYIIETASSYMIRSALTGANLTIDQKGSLFLVSGDGHQIVMGADFVKLGEADGDSFVQIDMETKDVLLQASGVAQLLLSESKSMIVTPGELQISVTGTGSPGHAITTEQVVNIIHNLLLQIGITQPGIVTGAALAAAAPVIVNAALALAAVAPITPVLPGITGGLLGPATTDPTGQFPGIGRPGFMY